MESARQTYCSNSCRQKAYRNRHAKNEDYGRSKNEQKPSGVSPGESTCGELDSVTAQLDSVTASDAFVTGDFLYNVLLRELEAHLHRGGTVHGFSTVMKRVFNDLGLGTGFGRVLRAPIGEYATRVRQTGPKAGTRLMTRSRYGTAPAE